MQHLYVDLLFLNNLVPYNNTRTLFEITDLSNKPILYQRPKNISKPYFFEQFNACYSDRSDFVKNAKQYDIPSIFNKPYLVIKTNCPLFAWLPYNFKTYQALVRLGILRNKPYESAHPAIHGFYVLSYVMRNHIKFSQFLLDKVDERRKHLNNGNCLSFHVRMGDLKSDFKESKSFIFETDLKSFVSCPIVNNYPNYLIFLSSDSSYAKNVIFNNTKDHKILSYDQRVKHSSLSSFSSASETTLSSLLDILTLGSCKEFVGTYGSTFSVLAASLVGKVPYLVSRNKSCFIPKEYFYL